MLAKVVTKRVVKLVTELRPHPLQSQIYQDLSDAELEDLAEDIRANGLRQPIEITPDGDVICGHQRLRAVRLIGWTTVACVVRQDLADQGAEAVKRRLIEDNLNRRNLGRLGVLRACAALRQITDKKLIKGTTLRDYVAKRFNLSGRTLDRQMKFLAAPPALQEAWDRRQLTDGDMRRVLQASSRRQKQIAEEILAGKPPKEAVRDLAKPAERSTPTVEVHVSRVVRALTELRAALPHDERAWPVEAWSASIPQLRIGRRLLRRLCDRADADQSAKATW